MSMSKRYSRFIVILFCAVLALFCAAILFSPKRSFSDVENRFLQQFPDLTLENLKTGKFMSQFETFITDQFPGRDTWVEAKAAMEQLSGKQENNGIYLGENGVLINRFEIPDGEKVDKNLGYVQTLTENTDIPVYFSLIPSAAHVWEHLLPEGAPNDDQLALLQQARQAVPGATWIDLESTLMAHKEDYIFYATDHHWTSTGAKYAYETLAPAMGLEVVDTGEGEVVSESFYGTSWSTAGTHWVGSDRILRFASDEGISVTAYPSGTPEEGALYHPESLEKKDKYTYFLGGNQPLCVIRNENKADAPKVLVVRDSYSDTLAPFLAQSCSEVHLFDVRYNLNSVSQYAADNGIDTILVLYSTTNFVTEGNLFVVAR